MDLIYADKDKTDVGVLKDYYFDLAFGSDENDFELTVSTNNNVCAEDYIIYIEETEYGGIIDSIEVDTAEKQLKYKGRTYHGILNSKVISPVSGNDYYTISGDANTVLGTLINKLSLSAFFKNRETTSGITVNHSFRYQYAYDGIKEMLEEQSAKLKISFEDGYAVLEAVAVDEYLDDEIDSDHLNFKISKSFNPINHLICLGAGELKSRTRVDLYCDSSGNISTTQTITGIEEIISVFDYANAESTERLINEGEKNLKELNGADTVELVLDDTYSFDIGDIIHATDIVTGISVTRKVIKKIVTINKNHLTVNYTVGE